MPTDAQLEHLRSGLPGRGKIFAEGLLDPLDPGLGLNRPGSPASPNDHGAGDLGRHGAGDLHRDQPTRAGRLGGVAQDHHQPGDHRAAGPRRRDPVADPPRRRGRSQAVLLPTHRHHAAAARAVPGAQRLDRQVGPAERRPAAGQVARRRRADHLAAGRDKARRRRAEAPRRATRRRPSTRPERGWNATRAISRRFSRRGRTF